jgi:hypothetical protein
MGETSNNMGETSNNIGETSNNMGEMGYAKTIKPGKLRRRSLT